MKFGLGTRLTFVEQDRTLQDNTNLFRTNPRGRFTIVEPLLCYCDQNKEEVSLTGHGPWILHPPAVSSKP